MRRIVNDADGHPKEMELFACAILKTTVEGYRAMLHRAGFRLRVLTVTECAYGAVLGAYLRRTGAENDDKDRCIVSIGHRSTYLYIYHGATFDSRREIDVGGRLIDEQIAEHCGVDIHLAHSYMRSDYNGVLEADYAREAYSRLAVEIMKAVNFYNYNNRDRELHDLYICGGGGGIEPMLRTIVETTRLTLHPVSELLSQQLSTEEPWTYLRAIGGVSEGIKGGTGMIAEKEKKTARANTPRRPVRCPQKTGINLNLHEKRTGTVLTLLIGALCITVLALAVAKFGVLDLYDRLADAQSAYAQAQQENRAAQEKLSHFDEVLSEYRTYSMEWMEDGEDSDLNFAVERTEMLDLIERTVMPYGTLSALQAQGDRVDVELNETDLDRIAEALSAVKASSIVESVGLELAETEKDRPADVMKCTLHIVLRGEAAE